MNTISENVEAFAAILIVSMAILGLAVALRSGTLKDIFEPSSDVAVLPPLVRDTILDAEKGLFNEFPPWAARQKQRLARSAMDCAKLRGAHKCLEWPFNGSTDPAPVGSYALELGPTQSPASPDLAVWDPYQTAIPLSTTKQFTTGYPEQYPAATVIAVPKDTPGHVKFIVDAAAASNDGIKALILEDNVPLNMNVDQRILPYTGLNVSGNFAHSFVLINQSDHDMFFFKDSVPLSDNGAVRGTYWRIRPNDWVLLWPSLKYWSNIDVSRPWEAFRLPDTIKQPNLAAYIAEVTMYEYLMPKAPLAAPAL